MFYLPIELREPSGKVTPKGPAFAKAKEVAVNLGGTMVIVKLPKHCPRLREISVSQHIKEKLDLDALSTYDSINPTPPWKMGTPLLREWRFCGPWFSGVLADIEFSLVVATRGFEEEETLFNPRVFEREIDTLLTSDYSTEKWYGGAMWAAPVHWQTYLHHEITVVSYDCVKSIGGAGFVKELVFPIENNTLVILWFKVNFLTSGGGDLASQEARLDREPMDSLINDIIHSLKVELSEKSRAQLMSAKDMFAEEVISQQRSPIKWTTEEDDELYARYLANPNDF